MLTVNVHDILLFHRRDRKYFDRILTSGRNPAAARNIIALWMWLEMISIDVFSHLKNSAADELEIGRFTAEAETILSFLRPNAAPPPPNSGIPLMASLISEQLDLRFFFFHSENVVRGMTRVLDGVGRLIFDDGLKSLMDSYEFSVRDAKDIGRRLRVTYPVPAMPPQLARRYVPDQPLAVPEDFRALFVTFSKGHPLNREDIMQYFTEKWGCCVERVMLELGNNHTTPMYGRIIFKSDSFVGLVLNGKHLVKFMIKGRQMWARQYVPWRTSM